MFDISHEHYFCTEMRLDWCRHTSCFFSIWQCIFINPKKEPTRWCQIQKKPVPKYNSLPSTPHTLTTETLVTKTQYIYEHFIKKYKKLWFSPMKYIYVDKLFFVDKYRIKMHGRMKFFMKLRIWFSKFAQIFGIIKICEY